MVYNCDMKKIFLSILLFFLIAGAAFADFIPSYTNSIKHYGIGAAKITNYVTIYEKPDLNSKVIEKIYWNNIGNFLSQNKEENNPNDIFLIYLPKENTVFFSVEDEDEEWLNICYNQKKELFGWIKKEDKNSGAKFYLYKDLIFKYGKKYGFYTFRNLPKDLKALHSSPNNDSDIIDDFNYPKFISPWLIQGNWMLAKVTTMDNQIKTGWFRWRSDTGRLFGFVNFK